jgi:antitoxin ParD1/3/4
VTPVPVQADAEEMGGSISRVDAPRSRLQLSTDNRNGAYYGIGEPPTAVDAKGENMNVSIGEYWEKFIESAVREGRYGSASEVVREGLRLVEERETKLKALRDEINSAIASGPRLTADEVSAGLDARMKRWKPKRS